MAVTPLNMHFEKTHTASVNSFVNQLGYTCLYIAGLTEQEKNGANSLNRINEVNDYPSCEASVFYVKTIKFQTIIRRRKLEPSLRGLSVRPSVLIS